VSYGIGNEPVRKRVSALFFGDTIFGRGIAKEYLESGTSMLDEIRGKEDRFFVGADINSLNLEGPIPLSQHNTTKEVSFSFSQEISLTLLRRMRIHAVNIANNHSLDAGTKGLDETIDLLSEHGIAPFGLGHCYRVSNIAASLSLCGFDDSQSQINPKDVFAEIQAEKKINDFVIASIHWGNELSTNITSRQRHLAHMFVDAGAAAVVGHGPHVIQATEEYNHTPIFYSLGNYLFDNSDPLQSSGLAVGLVLDQVRTSAYLYPIHTHTTRPQLYSKDEQQKFYEEYLHDFDRNKDPIIPGKIVFTRSDDE
jgi:poly-gamma-glutamate synthesis protein (capsule biosynthesis protein)